MRALVACEFSGIVRDAFAELGHDAWSCDLLDTERPGQHLQCDVRTVLNDGWDLMIAHPPCTHLAVSGARWFRAKAAQTSMALASGPAPTDQAESVAFVRALLAAPIPRIAIENPIGVLSRLIGKPDQIIQPHQFGHGETKATCLWLRGLPPLVPTELVPGRSDRLHMLPPGDTRWRERSRTFPGIAAAMARQWSSDPFFVDVRAYRA